MRDSDNSVTGATKVQNCDSILFALLEVRRYYSGGDRGYTKAAPSATAAPSAIVEVVGVP